MTGERNVDEGVKEYVLERIRFHVYARISKEQLQGPIVKSQIEWLAADIGSHLAVTMITELFGRKYEPIKYSHPADWWQAFKDQFAPDWFKHRWPVKNKVFTVNAAEVFPVLNFSGRKGTIVTYSGVADERWMNRK